jgi:hypothetical protein
MLSGIVVFRDFVPFFALDTRVIMAIIYRPLYRSIDIYTYQFLLYRSINMTTWEEHFERLDETIATNFSIIVTGSMATDFAIGFMIKGR